MPELVGDVVGQTVGDVARRHEHGDGPVGGIGLGPDVLTALGEPDPVAELLPVEPDQRQRTLAGGLRG